MRVLHLLKTSTGALWAVRQMRELVSLGVDVHAAMPPGGPRIDECRRLGIAVHALRADFPVGRPWALPAAFSGLRRLVGQVNPDIIHSHFVGSTLLMRLALGRSHPIPRIFQVPGPLHLETGPYGRIEIGLAGPNDHWIGSCSWTQNKYLAMGIPPNRVHMSFYGTDVWNFHQSSVGQLRRELNVPENLPLAALVAHIYPPKYYLGQFRGLKGHEDFFSAMVDVRNRCPDCLAVIVGSQWGPHKSYETKLRRLARGLLGDAAVFLGHRDDVPALYADLNVAVHPSLSENLGAAGESLLMGVPTVATSVGGLPDLVRDGQTGWLVPPRCPRQLARAIVEAISDPREAHRRACQGRELARNAIDVRRTAREVLDIYINALCDEKDAHARKALPHSQAA
jgi:glycosyltransferase involved in cell wall biosynthesis